MFKVWQHENNYSLLVLGHSINILLFEILDVYFQIKYKSLVLLAMSIYTEDSWYKTPHIMQLWLPLLIPTSECVFWPKMVFIHIKKCHNETITIVHPSQPSHPSTSPTCTTHYSLSVTGRKCAPHPPQKK